jgi:hypothetical protein
MILEIFLAFSGHPGLSRVEVLQRDAALDELLLEDVEHGAGALLTVGPDLHAALTRPGDGRPDAPEVEPGTDLLGGLVKRVVGLLAVDLRSDVEAGLARHGSQVRRVEC